MIGFGKSSRAKDHDYTFSQQILRIDGLLNGLGVSEFNLVGLSMGGTIGTQYCDEHDDRILSFVNIESDLPPENRFIGESAIRSGTEGRFEEWLREDFARETVISLRHQWPSSIRYLASLSRCRNKAFLDSAYEIERSIEPLPDGSTALVGKTFLDLKTPRVFCWGTDSLSEAAREFLNSSILVNKRFPGAFHWVMLDQTDQLYGFLADFLTAQ